MPLDRRVAEVRGGTGMPPLLRRPQAMVATGQVETNRIACSRALYYRGGIGGRGGNWWTERHDRDLGPTSETKNTTLPR